MTPAAHKEPLFGRYGEVNGAGTGRNPMRNIGRALSTKVRKHKRKGTHYGQLSSSHRRRGADSDSESESGGSSKSKSRHEKVKGIVPEELKQNWFAAFLSGIESRPDLPNILSYYAQLTLNAFLVLVVIYAIWSFWTTISADVDKASQKARDDALGVIAKCANDYVENRCGPDLRVPRLREFCEEWELCMNQDPAVVGRAKISAHTFATIINSFIEPISYKAMVSSPLVSFYQDSNHFSDFHSPPWHHRNSRKQHRLL